MNEAAAVSAMYDITDFVGAVSSSINSYVVVFYYKLFTQVQLLLI